MKAYQRHSTTRRFILIFFALSIHLSFAEARKPKDVPLVEIQDRGQVVNVVWAKPFAKAENVWIRMRLSMNRFVTLPPYSHLHIELHDADSNLLKVKYLELSQRDFRKYGIGRPHQRSRHQMINYDSGLSTDADIAKIVIRVYQEQHDHKGQSD